MNHASSTFRSLVIALVLACSFAVQAQTLEPMTSVESAAREMLPGILMPAEIATLSTPLDGMVRELHVQPGDQVSKGDLIATMDNRVALAALRVAQQAAQNSTNVRLAERQLAAALRLAERVDQAFAQNAASALERDRAIDALAEAKLQLEQAQEVSRQLHVQLELAQSRVDEHEVRSPFAGQLVRMMARAGESRNRATEIAVVANLTTLQVDLQIPLSYFGLLEPGKSYDLQLEAPVNRLVPAKLVHVEPQVDSATRSFRGRFVIDNSSQSIPYGVICRLVTRSLPSPVSPLAVTANDP